MAQRQETLRGLRRAEALVRDVLALGQTKVVIDGKERALDERLVLELLREAGPRAQEGEVDRAAEYQLLEGLWGVLTKRADLERMTDPTHRARVEALRVAERMVASPLPLGQARWAETVFYAIGEELPGAAELVEEAVRATGGPQADDRLREVGFCNWGKVLSERGMSSAARVAFALAVRYNHRRRTGGPDFQADLDLYAHTTSLAARALTLLGDSTSATKLVAATAAWLGAATDALPEMPAFKAPDAALDAGRAVLDRQGEGAGEALPGSSPSIDPKGADLPTHEELVRVLIGRPLGPHPFKTLLELAGSGAEGFASLAVAATAAEVERDRSRWGVLVRFNHDSLLGLSGGSKPPLSADLVDAIRDLGSEMDPLLLPVALGNRAADLEAVDLLQAVALGEECLEALAGISSARAADPTLARQQSNQALRLGRLDRFAEATALALEAVVSRRRLRAEGLASTKELLTSLEHAIDSLWLQHRKSPDRAHVEALKSLLEEAISLGLDEMEAGRGAPLKRWFVLYGPACKELGDYPSPEFLARLRGGT